MNILFFDTETTGLPLWNEPSNHPDQPYIVDLGAELWRVDGADREMIGQMDTLINPGVPIPPEVSAIHGISDEMVADAGTTEEALEAFAELVAFADLVVGHNIDFDVRLVRIAGARTWQEKWEPNVPTFCTMKKTTHLCKIPSPRGRGFKWPKLTEAIPFFFPGEVHEDAHRALPDAAASRRIYFHLLDNGLIS